MHTHTHQNTKAVLNRLSRAIGHMESVNSLEDMAAKIGCSPAHTSKLFKKEINYDIITYLSSVRIHYAKELLRTTKMTLEEISADMESVKRMVEEGRDCSEVLVQLSAVKAAINNTAKVACIQFRLLQYVYAFRSSSYLSSLCLIGSFFVPQRLFNTSGFERMIMRSL